MKQVLLRQGDAIIENIPAPIAEPGTLIIQVHYSCISAGTELSGLTHSGTPIWKRALADPWKVKKAFEMIATRGVKHTRSVVKGELEGGTPTGYSVAGMVLSVGQGVKQYTRGDFVACAGAKYAHHAEIVKVPENLVVAIPNTLDLAFASTVTLGSIAMQGVRRASPTLGETFVVVGLGILGQLTVQLLKANGCRVIGTDIDDSRITLAQSLGMDTYIPAVSENDSKKVFELTSGVGADGVIITAATPNERLLSASFELCRKKGRVVLVGDIPIRIDRGSIYKKELDFFISTSYGPGRYDRRYEEEGLDYPIGYVRWTENRNMSEYLNLIAENKVNIAPLVSTTYPMEQADEAFKSFKNPEKRPLIVLLKYNIDHCTQDTIVQNPKFHRVSSLNNNKIRLALIGAGGFAKGMHLPNLQSLKDEYTIHAIASRTGHNAQSVARQCEAAYSTTDYKNILHDPNIDAVLITTRHNLHTQLTLEFLKAGKHVMVEKPLSLSAIDLNLLKNFFSENKNAPLLLTGFNRRFSPHTNFITNFLEDTSPPIIINYRMNAGYLSSDHWVHSTEGGGRNIGEACHIYDLFTAITKSEVKTIYAQALKPKTDYYRSDDNFVATIGFQNGSVATLTYTSLGNKGYPKETMTIYSGDTVIDLIDYQKTRIFCVKERSFDTRYQDKGQLNELVCFAKALKEDAEWPIPLWQQFQATEISFEVEKQISMIE